MSSSLDLREALRRGLRRHPRVAFQGQDAAPEDWSRLANGLPLPVAFGRARYLAGLWILDWDHRLPSKNLILRLYAYYTEPRQRQGEEAFLMREAQIDAEDEFPEFDVPDFAGLPADEAYEVELEPGGSPSKLKLVSEWRREIEPANARRAIEVVRKAPTFAEVKKRVARRPPGLGDLEAAEWTSPCDSGHARWAIDVWYLTAFNGVVGEGHAFLVDPEEGRIVSERDFQFRAG